MREDFKETLDQLNRLVVMTDSDSVQEFKDAVVLIDDLRRIVPAGLGALLTDHLDIVSRQCADLATGGADDPQGVLEALSKELVRIQTICGEYEKVTSALDRNSDSGSSDSPGQRTKEEEAVVEDSSEFVLSEWVDESIFREFLANQVHVIEEIEGVILQAEAGRGDCLADLRRLIHTMKGEAGVLGLDDLGKVCHAIEDFADNGVRCESIAEALFYAKDWISSALDSYADMQLPRISAEDVTRYLTNARLAIETTAIDDDDVSSGTSEQGSSASATEPTECSQVRDDTGEGRCIHLATDEETLELMGEFLQETDDGLHKADAILMDVESDDASTGSVDALFRIFHTIKGVAGFLDLDDISKLAHSTENVLNKVRQDELRLIGVVLDAVFDSTAMLAALLTEIRQAIEGSGQLMIPEQLHTLMMRLDDISAGKDVAESPLPRVSPGEKIGVILSNAPFNIAPLAIESALSRQQSSGRPLGQELVANNAATPKQVSQALRAQRESSENGGAGKRNMRIRETVKVDLQRVDNLVEMIGELVIVESMLEHSPEILGVKSVKVRTHLGQLAKITRDLQDVGMRMRMVPLRGVFQKMARMVRDLSQKSNKRIRYVQSGEGTEIDRSMVEQISDPLIHMIRNAVDHGIESPDDRKRCNKSETGEVRLSAYHEGGSLIIELADDGKGLDREAIVAKAKTKGLISDDTNMSDSDIFGLIFHPGFSTAKTVTDISGRGVGMDVVKRKIDALRGRVSISSEAKAGTTFKIILPLTLAIIDGMLVACGSERYIIPTLSIIESIQLTEDMFATLGNKNELINVRGDIVPMLRLSELFSIKNAVTAPREGIVVLAEGVGQKIGIFVDSVVTQQQVVIKNLGESIANTPFVSGAAILSDGRVGLIVNVDELGESYKTSAVAVSLAAETGVSEMSNATVAGV